MADDKNKEEGWPLQTVMGNLDGFWCQEVVTANQFMTINCRKPAVCLIWHDRDKRAYFMCHMCGSHNMMNRSGRLVIDATPGGELVREKAGT